MSKAILVIEIDDELVKQMDSCDFVVTDRYGSKTIYPVISYKPMPQKLDANDWHRMFSGEYKIREAKGYGYNYCIDEIFGGEK